MNKPDFCIRRARADESDIIALLYRRTADREIVRGRIEFCPDAAPH